MTAARPPRPSDDDATSCDWGGCDRPGWTWRWSDEHDEWLPVCHLHQEGGARGRRRPPAVLLLGVALIAAVLAVAAPAEAHPQPDGIVQPYYCGTDTIVTYLHQIADSTVLHTIPEWRVRYRYTRRETFRWADGLVVDVLVNTYAHDWWDPDVHVWRYDTTHGDHGAVRVPCKRSRPYEPAQLT